MPIRYQEECAFFEGHCAPDEALELIDWLRARPAAAIDLQGCEHLHASLLQVLLAARPKATGVPADPFLGRWIAPMLGGGP